MLHPSLGEKPGFRRVAEVVTAKIASGEASIGILGLGYVGLPLAVEFARHFQTVGFEVDPRRLAAVQRASSYIVDVPERDLADRIESGMFRATDNFAGLAEMDCIVLCVPTPLLSGKLPDMRFVENAAAEVLKRLRPGQLVILESTTYPGTTEETLLPLFESTGLRLDRDFLLAFSPERVDPGNPNYKICDIPKVVGGCSDDSTRAATALYEGIVPRVHPVRSARVAEAAKLWENTFRSVNIALANEMALLCRHLGLETADVMSAAASKPFGFMPFRPGPGVGGHCIPLDPHYLSFTASKHGYYPRFIMLADQINSAMPQYVVDLVNDALNQRGVALNGARVLILGVAYKEDVDDVRNSPAIAVIERLRAKGARVRYHDPFVPRVQTGEDDHPPAPRRDLRTEPVERRKPEYAACVDLSKDGRRRTDPLESRALTAEEIRDADCVLVLTGHTTVDYEAVVQEAKLVVDTRGVVAAGGDGRVVSL